MVVTAESLTGGLLCSTLVDIAGASSVVAGGVAAYRPQTKIALLGVPAALIAEHGTVDARTAEAMARGALAGVPEATIAIATTGVAGPEPSEGKAVGTVFVALADTAGVDVLALQLSGDRRQIRESTVHAALSALIARLGEQRRP